MHPLENSLSVFILHTIGWSRITHPGRMAEELSSLNGFGMQGLNGMCNNPEQALLLI
jgi:hypothetical protein